MSGRHLTTGITLLVLVGILVAGVILGVKTFLAPLPGKDKAEPTPSPTCTTKAVKKGQRIKSSQVQVSVFNGGSRGGLADETLTSLTNRGFKAGDAANAPEGTSVRKVQVWTTQPHDNAARLVARQFGRATKVRVVQKDLGPGVDVVVGNDFEGLVPAKREIVVKRSSSVCVPVPSRSATATPNS